MEGNNDAISLRDNRKEKEYDSIREMLNNNNHKTTITKQDIIQQVNWFLELLEERGETDAYQYYFCYMMKCKCYYRLKDLKHSIKYGELALRYVKQIQNIAYDKLMKNLIITIWGLGNSYAQLGKLRKAMRYYDKCEKYYKNKKDLINLSKIYNTKAYYSLNENLSKKAINIKINLYGKDMNRKQSKDLDNAYDTLCYIYICHKHFNNFFQTLNKIQNENKRKQIYNHYESIISKSNQLAL